MWSSDLRRFVFGVGGHGHAAGIWVGSWYAVGKRFGYNGQGGHARFGQEGASMNPRWVAVSGLI
jgi:hypothetical protein